jgi:hypothetical protein
VVTNLVAQDADQPGALGRLTGEALARLERGQERCPARGLPPRWRRATGRWRS